jgi:tetratricopeptide (TPR) repeat protein
VLFAVIALFAQQRTGALRPAYNYFVSYRAGQAFYGLCFYLWKTLMPVSLSPLYELPYDFDAWMPLFWLCAALVTSISVVLFLVRRRWPALLACWLYYLLAVAPLLGVAQSGPQLVADRYSYLSCLSWSLLGGAVFYQFLNSIGDRANRRGRFAASAALASALILILSTLASKQTKVWRDSKTLWEHVITTGSDPAIARYNMARIFEHEGKLSESIKYYRRAIEIYPTYADAHYNLARLLAKSGEQTQAIYHYRQALRFTPDDAETLNNLALLLAVRGETDEALKYLRRAVQANPNYPQAFYNLGRILAGQGYYAEAISNHQQALKLKPDQAEIHFELGKALAGQGRMEEAAGFFQSAIALKPDFPAAHVALSQLLAEQGKNDSDAQRYPEARRRSETRNQDRLSP